ncbi:hypothetical protein BDU57DRAFT_523665 [Ampelomyces quisqualis]|uniref:Uncharacterized protein n=1 Tax=Ampelomyces quisqualis TaxID=50730 RepID=A0A6A5QBN4_AMPQU|nr:hypothetical protein BDU57DRAFT_523665 [Ampelomyces quisqualis]
MSIPRCPLTLRSSTTMPHGPNQTAPNPSSLSMQNRPSAPSTPRTSRYTQTTILTEGIPGPPTTAPRKLHHPPSVTGRNARRNAPRESVVASHLVAK